MRRWFWPTVGLALLAIIVVSTTVNSIFSPRAEVEAEIALMDAHLRATPTVLWNATVAPALAAAEAAEALVDVRTGHAVARAGMWGTVVLVALAAFVGLVVFTAVAFVRVRTAARSPDVRTLAGWRPTLVGGSQVYDPRTGGIVLLGQPREGDPQIAEALGQADAARIAALAAVLKRPALEWSRGERAMVRYYAPGDVPTVRVDGEWSDEG